MYLTLTDLLLWALIATAAYLWWYGRGLKDAALKAAKRYCQKQQLQLLDESLVLDKLQMSRDERGHLCLQRRYRFEFSATGDERYQGTIALTGKRIIRIELQPHRMPDSPEL
jgi:hypothetical protein